MALRSKAWLLSVWAVCVCVCVYVCACGDWVSPWKKLCAVVNIQYVDHEVTALCASRQLDEVTVDAVQIKACYFQQSGREQCYTAVNQKDFSSFQFSVKHTEISVIFFTQCVHAIDVFLFVSQSLALLCPFYSFPPSASACLLNDHG